MPRHKVRFFALGSYGDLYIDDILITQDYKEGETFDDPFYFSTWQLAEQVWDPTRFEFEVPERVLGNEIHQRAQAVRMHVDDRGSYDGEVESEFSDYDLVATTAPSGVSLIDNDLSGRVKVIDGTLHIDNADGEDVSVISAAGIVANLGNAASLSYRVDVKGVYVVKIGSKSIKIAI